MTTIEETLGKGDSYVTCTGNCHYPNLYYCCNTCNRNKGASWPDTAEAGLGFVLIDPCARDPFGSDIVEHPNGHLAATTNAGEFMIRVVRLNREELVRFRARRKRIGDLIAGCKTLLRELDVQPPWREAREPIEAILADLEIEWQACRAGSPWQ